MITTTLVRPALLFALCSLSTGMYAQVNTAAKEFKDLKDQLYKIMMALPSQFATIKGKKVYEQLDDHFHTTVPLPGMKSCTINKGLFNDRWEYTAVIARDNDNVDLGKLFEQWKVKLDSINFKGVPVIRYSNTKYTTDQFHESYLKGQAWRMGGNKIFLDPKYKDFTVRLEYVDMDQGGTRLDLVCSEY